MKYALVFFTLFLSTTAFSQELDCKKFKNGTFKLVSGVPEIGDFIITRKGNTQIEYSELTRQKFRLKVKWIDQCTYQLTFDKVLEDPQNVGLPDTGVPLVTVSIINTTANSYIQETSTEGTDFVFKSELIKIK